MLNSDVLFFATQPPPKDVVAAIWPNNSVHFQSYYNPGYQKGAIMALNEAIDNNWFKNYDWVMRINPDVFVRNESFLLQMMLNDDVDGIFVDCYSMCNSSRCTAKKVHTDFFVIRPVVLPKHSFYVRKNAEKTFTGYTRATREGGRDRWLPGTTQRGMCRVTGENSPVIHSHAYAAACVAKFQNSTAGKLARRRLGVPAK